MTLSFDDCEPPEEEYFEISWDQIILHWFWQLENMDPDEARHEIDGLSN